MKKLIVLTILLIVLVLNACGGGTSQGKISLTEADAQSIASGGMQGVEGLTSIFRFSDDPESLIGNIFILGTANLKQSQLAPLQNTEDCRQESKQGNVTTITYNCDDTFSGSRFIMRGTLVYEQGENFAKISTSPKLEMSITSNGESSSFIWDIDVSVNKGSSLKLAGSARAFVPQG